MKYSVVWSPGVTLEDVDRQTVTNAVEFYKDKQTAANSLKIPLKLLEKHLSGFEKEYGDYEKQRIERKQKEEEFVRRSRGLPPLSP